MMLCSFRSSQLLHNASHQDEPAPIFAHTHLQLSVCGRQAGTANCSSPFFLRVICLTLCLRRGSGYGSSAPCWATGEGWKKMPYYITIPPFFNAHTRAYSSPCQLETGPPIKAFTIRSQNHGRNKGHVGILVERGIIRYFFHSSAGSVKGKMCMRRALGVPAPKTRGHFRSLSSEK